MSHEGPWLKPRVRKPNPTKFELAEFVSWDGEGINPPDGGPQRYVLFGNDRGRSIANLAGLSSRQCLELMLDEAAVHGPNAVHVVFSGTYDVNMFLRDVPHDKLESLHRTGFTRWRQYAIEWMPAKLLSVKCWDTGRKIRLWDVWPFFQSSFVKALRAWEAADEPTIANIEAMKSSRNTFADEDLPAIREYWQDELRLLTILMTKLHEQLTVVGMKVKRWDGPGAVASVLYGNNGTKKSMRKESDDNVRYATRCAFSGGRIEAVQFGRHAGTTYVYDINSAYPAVIARLPDLRNGKWVHRSAVEEAAVKGFNLFRLRYTGTVGDGFSPLWHRAKDGSVNYGTDLEGWYWGPEAELAVTEGAEPLEAWEWHGDETSRPFSWVAEMYEQRRKWKAQNNPAERVLKLGLNSLYGKMVQQKGARQDDDGTWRLPPFHQLEWGGYVTASTRAALYRLASQDPGAIIGFETDGVFSTRKLAADLGNQLGQWSETVHSDGITYVQPGVYWLGAGEGSAKFRGFDAGTLSHARVLEAWEKGNLYVEVKSTRFRGLGVTLAQNRWDTWQVWQTNAHNLTVWPIGPKRGYKPAVIAAMSGKVFKSAWGKPLNELQPTLCLAEGDGELSRPYPVLWEMPSDLDLAAYASEWDIEPVLEGD